MITLEQKLKFVKDFYLPVLTRCKSTGIPFPHAISQIAYESAYGTKAPNFNFMGIKAKKDASGQPTEPSQLLWTWERFADRNKANNFPERDPSKDYEKNGFWYVRVKDYFKKFNSPDESLSYYFNLLQNSRYKPCLIKYQQGSQTWQEYTKCILKSGYATGNPDIYVKALEDIFTLIETLKKQIIPDKDSIKSQTKNNLGIFLIIGFGLLFWYVNKQQSV